MNRRMREALLSGLAGLCLMGCAEVGHVSRLEVVRSWPAAEANQGVAVDAEHFYVIDDKALGKYAKATGRKVAEWKAPKGSGVIHMNAGVVAGGRLYVAHSNFPAKPDESSLEIFEAATLRPVARHVFERPLGSLTWAIPDREGWLACFAHYRSNSDPAKSRLVRYDADWKLVAVWSFPPELVERFGKYSSSCGSLGLDGFVWVSGHDAYELYRLSLPEGGGVARWAGTVPFVSAGQAFAWDPSRPRELYSIQRKTREVILSRLGE
jgi:hypothetical protein